MEKFAPTALLLTAIVLPVVLYWLLRSRLRVKGLVAAAIAIAAGWALNVAWASVVARDPAQADTDTLSIAMYFGWACPTVLVILTWVVWRFVARRAG